MSRASLLLALVCSAAVAAPVPPPGEKELIAKHWGATKGSAKFSLTGQHLTIRSDGVRSIDPVQFGNTVPRAARTLTGDFEVTVRVDHVSSPNTAVESETDTPQTKAGLFLYSEDVELVVVRSRTPDGEKYEARLVTWHGPCTVTRRLADVEVGQSTYLRMTRKDKSLAVSHSSDGKTWSKPVAADEKSEINDDVTVGVFLAHNTHQEGVTASFDKFTVAKPK
jgi:hypothetical protein